MKSLTLEEIKSGKSDDAIDTVIVAFPDYFGRLVGKRLTTRHFLEIVDKGWHACNYLLGCDISNEPIPGLDFCSWDLGYGDFLIVPDLSTLIVSPWEKTSALVLGDIVTAEGKPVETAPRAILRRQVKAAGALGLNIRIASELEFYLFDIDDRTLRDTRYSTRHLPASKIQDYDLLTTGSDEPLLRQVRTSLESSGIEIEGTKGEWAPGQVELNLAHSDPMEMADRHIIAKHAVKAIARRLGRAVTFMAKWNQELAGSSCHIHSSVTYRTRDRSTASTDNGSLAGQWIAGQLAIASESTLLFAPNVNSYKRLRPDTFAPTAIVLGEDNRTMAYRVIDSHGLRRIENRIPGADANPYLAFAATLAGGLHGIETRLVTPEFQKGNAYHRSGLVDIPGSLEDAITKFRASEVFRKAFGPMEVEHICSISEAEVRWHRKQVTEVEVDRYFERS